MPDPLPPAGQRRSVTVHKCDAEGRAVTSYSGSILSRGRSRITLLATFTGNPVAMGDSTLEPGDQLVEHHFGDRWYNVFEIYGRDTGRLKGWYCNVARPAVLDREQVAADDLAVDLWIEPGSQPVILDWDEFQSLALSPAEREAALRGLEELQNLARTGKLPRTR
jgi:predicted RNA-binding protein associated with RNAse of E/G family